MWLLESLSPRQIESICSISQAASSQVETQPFEPVEYHLPVGTHSVGRKDAAIELPHDKAVSRKHASFNVPSPSAGATSENSDMATAAVGEPLPLTLIDHGSTFGTFVNDVKLTKESPVVVNDGDIIRIGAQWTAFRAKWQPLVFCVTRMGKKDKNALKAAANLLGANMVTEWCSNVTHMATTKDLVFTVKTVLAIVAGVPIVHPNFAEAILHRSKLSDPLPDPQQHALPSELPAALGPCQDEAVLSARPRHLANYLVVSLAPHSEGNLLASAAGAHLLPLHPLSSSSSSSSSSSGVGAEGEGDGSNSSGNDEGVSDAEFAAVLEVLASSTPVKLLPARFPTPAIREALALRSNHTVVLLQPSLPSGSGGSGNSGSGGSDGDYELALTKRAEQLSSLTSLRTVTTGGFAQAVVSLEPLLDLAGDPVPSSSWADLAKQSHNTAAAVTPAVPTTAAVATSEAAAASSTTAASARSPTVASPTARVAAQSPGEEAPPAATPASSSRVKRKTMSELEAPKLSKAVASGRDAAAPADPAVSGSGADTDALDSFYDVPGDDDDAAEIAPAPMQLPSRLPPSAKKMRQQSKESPGSATTSTNEEQGPDTVEAEAEGAHHSPPAALADDNSPQPSALPTPSSAKSATDIRARRHAPQEQEDKSGRSSSGGGVGRKPGNGESLDTLAAAADARDSDAVIDRATVAAAEAPPQPPPKAKRKAPVLVDGWLARSDNNYRARGAGRLEANQEDNDEEDQEDEGDSSTAANEGDEKGEGAEEDESRYKPLEEAVSLVVVPESTQQAFASQARKRAAHHRSHGSGGGAPAGGGAGGVPNFKKFRKNHVLYGPAVGDFVALVEVSAEENERVAQMRREEGEAEEYERQADALFADNNGRSNDRGRRR